MPASGSHYNLNRPWKRWIARSFIWPMQLHINFSVDTLLRYISELLLLESFVLFQNGCQDSLCTFLSTISKALIKE